MRAEYDRFISQNSKGRANHKQHQRATVDSPTEPRGFGRAGYAESSAQRRGQQRHRHSLPAEPTQRAPPRVLRRTWESHPISGVTLATELHVDTIVQMTIESAERDPRSPRLARSLELKRCELEKLLDSTNASSSLSFGVILVRARRSSSFGNALQRTNCLTMNACSRGYRAIPCHHSASKKPRMTCWGEPAGRTPSRTFSSRHGLTLRPIWKVAPLNEYSRNGTALAARPVLQRRSVLVIASFWQVPPSLSMARDGSWDGDVVEIYKMSQCEVFRNERRRENGLALAISACPLIHLKP